MIPRFENVAHRGLTGLVTAALLAACGFGTARAQDTTVSGRAFLLEGRVGTTETLGRTSGYLVGPDVAIGVTFAFQLKGSSWGWVSADYKPWNSSTSYQGPRVAPGIGLYTLTGGVSRTFGLPLASTRWRPFELGLGVGATQGTFQSMAQNRGLPPGVQGEDLFSSELFSSSRWRPAAAARLRVRLPLGRFADLSGTAGLLASYVGDVPLWDGGWEPTGDGSRYRPTSEIWSFGTIYTVPLTLGFGFRF